MIKDTLVSVTKDLKLKTNVENINLKNYKDNSSCFGVFENVENAISSAVQAQKILSIHYTKEQREKIITEIRKAALQNKEALATMILEETHMGRYEDKILKHELVAKYTPGTEDLTTTAWSEITGSQL